MLKCDSIISDIVKAVSEATEDNPFTKNGFVYLWVDGSILYIKMEKISSVIGINFILECLYKERLLEDQYIFCIEDNDCVSLIRQEDRQLLGMYQAGSLIIFNLDNYGQPEPTLTFEVSEPALIFGDLLGIC